MIEFYCASSTRRIRQKQPTFNKGNLHGNMDIEMVKEIDSILVSCYFILKDLKRLRTVKFEEKKTAFFVHLISLLLFIEALFCLLAIDCQINI